MQRRSLLKLSAATAALPSLAPAVVLPDDVMLRSMRDEMKRSMRKLQLENLDKPYFLSYRIVETTTVSATASFGALSSSSETRRRLLSTECRVGTYELDNSNFYSARNALSGVIRIQANFGSSLSLDDDYDEFRRQLWISTDSAYKQALDELAKKRAALENRTRTGAAIADFAKDEKTESNETRAGRLPDTKAAEALVKQLSALFRDTKGIDNSFVRMEATRTLTRFISSEGTEYFRSLPGILLQWNAEAQASDGMPVLDTDSLWVESIDQLPDIATLTTRIRDFQKRILSLREAKTLARYAGPVLFEGQAAAELFSQGFATALLGIPRIVVDDQRFEGIFAASAGVFSDKISTRVLPSHFKVTDDPTRKGEVGSVEVDEEGVKTKPTVVVQSGILKRLLNTRALVPGVTDSTASRRPSGVAPSNLIVESSKARPLAELKAEMLQLVKDRNLEFGVIVRRMANAAETFLHPRGRNIIITSGSAGQSLSLSPVVEAVKVYADGREELLRNLEISGFTSSAFRDLVGASSEVVPYKAPFRNTRTSPLMGGPILPGRIMVQFHVPSLLFEDVTLQLPAGEVPKLPFISHPSFA